MGRFIVLNRFRQLPCLLYMPAHLFLKLPPQVVLNVQVVEHVCTVQARLLIIYTLCMLNL